MRDETLNESSNLDFTTRAKKLVRNVAKDPYFRDADSDLIFNMLNNQTKIVVFGDFLKRYIYRKAEMHGNYREIPIEDYQEIICSEFRDRQTPCSFTETTVRIRNAAKNWIEQKTVNRSVVLLLGFGLGMNVEDVNTFLTKALQEPELNAKDPLEVICWYCYQYGYNYLVFEDLWKQYQENTNSTDIDLDQLDSTLVYRQKMLAITDTNSLMKYLAELPIVKGSKRQSISAREQFDILFKNAKTIAASILTESERDTAQKNAERLEYRLQGDDKLYDYQKVDRVLKEKENYRPFTEDEIGAADIESIILSAIPKDASGNLVSMKRSTLNNQFDGKRLSRQHLSEILSGRAPITRHDLITLNFFVLSQNEYLSRQKRYAAFIDSTNAILRKCGMGPIYLVNPYESFILMCIISEDPLCTYADVWEMSYDGE